MSYADSIRPSAFPPGTELHGGTARSPLEALEAALVALIEQEAACHHGDYGEANGGPAKKPTRHEQGVRAGKIAAYAEAVVAVASGSDYYHGGAARRLIGDIEADVYARYAHPTRHGG